MADSWNIPRCAAHPSLGAHRDPTHDNGLVADWTPVDTVEPIVIYADARDGRCTLTLVGIRCPQPVNHPGPCRFQGTSETGVAFAVAWGQRATSAEPGRALAAVLALHAGEDLAPGEPHAVRFCTECHQAWPCRTARTLDRTVDLTEGASL